MDFEEITDAQGNVTYLRRDGGYGVANVKKSLKGWLKEGIDPRPHVSIRSKL
jgi:hypothetical protein